MAPSAAAAAPSTLVAGRVKALVERESPFGFVTPDDGGEDHYFDERLLGDGKSWAELKQQVAAYAAGAAPALFVSTSVNGRWRAKGLFVIDPESLRKLDANGDDQISQAEIERFLARHPELKDSSLTLQELEHRRRVEEFRVRRLEAEARSCQRDRLFKRQDAAEDALYAKRDAARGEADKWRREGDRLWSEGKKAEARECHGKAKEFAEQARHWKQRATELDWKNNEDMFEYVQSAEHAGQVRDGTWIDLHGLSGEFAVHKTVEFLKSATDRGIAKVEVITGAGHHSGKSGPVVKKMVLESLANPPPGLQGLSFSMGNEGAISVVLPMLRPLKRPAPAPPAPCAPSAGGAAAAAAASCSAGHGPAGAAPESPELAPKPPKLRRLLAWFCLCRARSRAELPR